MYKIHTIRIHVHGALSMHGYMHTMHRYVQVSSMHTHCFARVLPMHEYSYDNEAHA